MKKIKKQFKAIIFDMDGTILNTETIWDNAVSSFVLSKVTSEFTPQQKQALSSLAGVALKDSTSVLREHFNITMSAEDYISEVLKHVTGRIQHEVSFIDGFREFHKMIKDHNIPHALATNCDSISLASFVKHMELDKFFGDKIFNVDHVQKAKPAPDLFLHAAAQLNAKPEECLVFEDSLPGFLAAKSAGMACIAIKNNSNHTHLHHTHHHIETYHHALDALYEVAKTFSERKKAKL